MAETQLALSPSLNEFYRSEEVLEALLLQLKSREAWVRWGGEPGPRPCVVESLDGLKELIFRKAALGIVEVFHSVELFSDPMKLEASDPSQLRIGWDYVIDIDSEDLEAAKELTSALVNVLESFNIIPKVKFSGRKGFHIIVSGMAFNIFKQSDWLRAYDFLPSNITSFLLHSISPETRKTAKVDMQIYTPRRLLRCAYSLHHSGYVSVPVYDVANFKLKDAKPENVREIDLGWIYHENRIEEGRKLLEVLRIWLEAREKSIAILNSMKKIKRTGETRSKQKHIKWIERLMEKPVDDGRHRLLWLVIAPYLVNVKKLSLEEAYLEARRYFQECDRVKKLSRRFDREVKYYLQYAARKRLRPLSLRTLREKPEYQDLWRIVSRVLEGRG